MIKHQVWFQHMCLQHRYLQYKISTLFAALFKFAVLFKRIGQAGYYCFSVLRLRRVAACPALRVFVLLSIVLPLVSHLYSAHQALQSNTGASFYAPLRRVHLFERFMYGHANGTAAQFTAQRKKFFGKILSERFKRNLEKIQSSGLSAKDKERLRGFFVTQEIESDERAQILAGAFSPYENLLAAGFDDKRIKIWERKSDNFFSCVQTLTGHERWVRALAFSPDGTLLVSGSEDESIKIWDRKPDNSFSCIQTFGNNHWVSDLVFSPDGTLLVSAASRGIKVWQRDSDNSFSCIQTFTDHKYCVSKLAFSPDGTLFVSGSDDTSIKIWQRDSNNFFSCIQTLMGHKGWVKALAFSPEGTLLVSGCDEARIKIWMSNDQQEYALLSTVKIGEPPVLLEFLPNSYTLLVVQAEKNIVLCEFYASLEPQELDLLIKIYSDKNLIAQNYNAFFKSLSNLEKIILSQIRRAALPDFFLRYYAREGQEA